MTPSTLAGTQGACDEYLLGDFSSLFIHCITRAKGAGEEGTCYDSPITTGTPNGSRLINDKVSIGNNSEVTISRSTRPMGDTNISSLI